MRTFYVHADINKLFEQVGLSDDWIGEVIDGFVIDYVFNQRAVIGEIMDLSNPTWQCLHKAGFCARASPALRDRWTHGRIHSAEQGRRPPSPRTIT